MLGSAGAGLFVGETDSGMRRSEFAIQRSGTKNNNSERLYWLDVKALTKNSLRCELAA